MTKIIDKPWQKSEGIFETPTGKWIVSVKSKNNRTPFTTLCQRDTKEQAELEYQDYLENQK